MGKILKLLKPYRFSVFMGLFLKFVESLTELLLPVIMADIITAAILKQDFSVVIPKGALMLGIIVFNIIIALFGQYFAAKVSTSFGRDLRQQLFEKVNSLSFRGLNTFGTSSLINRITNDTNQVQNSVFMAIRVGTRAPFMAIGSFVMAIMLDVNISLVFLICIPMVGYTLYYVMKKTVPMYDDVQSKLDSVTTITRENFTGARVVRAFSKQDDEISRFQESTENYQASAVKVGKLSSLINPITTLVMQLGIVAILLVGGHRVFEGSLEAPQITAFITYILQILLAMMILANLIVIFIKASASGNRIQKVFELPTENQEKQQYLNNYGTQKPIQPDCCFCSEDEQPCLPQEKDKQTSSELQNLDSFQNTEQSADIKAFKKDIADLTKEGDNIILFKNVYYAYKNSYNILCDISFNLKKGESLGIIGGTGSGKTSLVNLLPRFYDATGGEIFIDGKNILDYDIVQLREMIGFVPQKALLIQGTIRENLAMGNANITEEDMYKALEIAQSKFVNRYPEKLDKHIEQGGRNLSGGQRQRLTIARALAKKPKILILDDSSSALDYATDAALYRSLKKEKNSMSIVMISQRVFSIKRADKILVLHCGKIAGLGTHEELLKNCEVYMDIYESQTKD